MQHFENKIIYLEKANSQTVVKVNQFESLHNFIIPPDLREIIINEGQIAFEKKYFIRIVDANFKQEHSLESILSFEEMIQAMHNLKDDNEFKENELLAFGETLGSSVICIGIGEKNYGKIFVFDWDFGLTEVAISFYSFVNSLF